MTTEEEILNLKREAAGLDRDTAQVRLEAAKIDRIAAEQRLKTAMPLHAGFQPDIYDLVGQRVRFEGGPDVKRDAEGELRTG